MNCTDFTDFAKFGSDKIGEKCEKCENAKKPHLEISPISKISANLYAANLAKIVKSAKMLRTSSRRLANYTLSPSPSIRTPLLDTFHQSFSLSFLSFRQSLLYRRESTQCDTRHDDMYHNPFRPTTHSAPGDSNVPGISSRDKSTQTSSFSNKSTQTRKRLPRGDKNKSTQTSSRLRQRSKESQMRTCVLKPKKKRPINSTETGKCAPEPTKPKYPLFMYGSPRTFPTFEAPHGNHPKEEKVDLYAFAGGYKSGQMETNGSDQTEQNMEKTDGGRTCENTPWVETEGAESSVCAAFSSCSD